MAMTWRGPIAPLDRPDGRGRRVKVRNVDTDVRPMPLPFRWQRYDYGGHHGAVDIGTMDTAWIDDDGRRLLWASGRWDEEDELARQAFSKVKRKFARHLSVDVDGGTGEVMGVTMVHCPAFKEAEIRDIFDGEAVEADETQVFSTLTGRQLEAFSVTDVSDEHVEWALQDPAAALGPEDDDEYDITTFAADIEEEWAYQQMVVAGSVAFNWVDDVGGLPKYIKRMRLKRCVAPGI